MARITAELFATLDGTVSSPQDWHGPYWDPEAGERTERLLLDSDVMLLGRNTYLEHAAYWPTDTGTMADRMNAIPKVVVSGTLSEATWNNTTIARDGLAAAVKALGDADVVVTGSVALVKSLLELGLLSELRLIVDPLVIEGGTRLFTGSGDLRLALKEAVPYSAGAVSLHYAT